MDDTHNSRASDAAAATRKRRSSILKSQRPPRTPFSELEFNVATPTDTAKSRRVSFSRRTGVAEFITNEATTTWKNFYEEHNKSLESSGNESGANAPRPVGHIGKRIFDQQFQDVEAVDFGATLDSGRNINTSINNVNFTQQFASLECTGDDRKLTAPQQNFEMSAFTDHQSKLFGDDLAVPAMGEASGRMDVDFSAIQNIGEVNDDLDEIQNDLQRAQSNVVCPGPFTGRRSLSEYIEVDLNATHVSIKNDEDDMSITDTIHSPKVQEISKSQSFTLDKKANISKDWVADKENIALNPYVAPKESTNFAINDECDKILVFDGKRLTIQSDKEADNILKGSTDDLKPKPKVPQRKTIVLNTNDDLPNFVENPHMSTSNGILSSASFRHSVMYDLDDELTNESNILANQKSTQGIDFGNISTTQAIPSNILVSNLQDLQNSKVIDSDNVEADISLTQAVPSKIIGPQDSQESQRHRTIVYENNAGDISMTQAISANILLNESKSIDNQKPETGRRRTILYEDGLGNISMTQAVPVNILLNENNQSSKPESERRRTILYDNDMGNISMTQAIPTNVIYNENNGNKPESERRRTIIYDTDLGNVSVTQSVPTNILINANKPELERRRTILYDNEMSNISITQAIPANIILNQNKDGNLSEPERRRTIIYENDTGNVSITQAIPPHILVNENKDTDKSKTILYDNIEADISMTQAIPTNLLISGNSINPDSVKRIQTIVFESDGDISITRALPSKIINPGEPPEPAKRKTILFDNDSLGNISITQAIPVNIIHNETSLLGGEKRRTMVQNNADNISITQTVPTREILPAEGFGENINILTSDTNVGNISINRDNSSNIILSKEKRKTIVYEDEAGNISITQVLPTNIFRTENIEVSQRDLEDKKNIVSSESDVGDLSITRGVPTNIMIPGEKRNTIVYEDKTGNISVTQTVPTNIFEGEQKNVEIDPEDKINIISSESNVGDETIARHVKNVSLPNGQCKTNVLENKAGHISETRAIPTDVFGKGKGEVLDKQKTILHDSISPDIPITQAVLVNVFIVNNATEKRKSIMYNTEAANALADTSNAVTREENLDNQSSVTDVQGETDTSNQDPENSSTDIDSDNNVANMPLVPAQLVLKSQDNLTDEDNRVTSSDSLIHIIRDTDDETPKENADEKPHKSLTWKDNTPRAQNSPLSLEYKEEADAQVSANLPKKLDELITRHYEKMLDSDLKAIEPHDKSESQDRLEVLREGMSFKDANDTNELLEMLSDLTDRRPSKEPEKPEKTESIEPRRLSVAPNRLSIVLSREDLMNNISMAQAALQKSIEMDDSIEETVDETTSDTPIEDINRLPQKTARVSNEVVKKLQFEEDESASDASIKSDIKGSPLRKTAVGETSYMKENKAKVIPSYLKDVSDEIKALMNDLVKPNIDTVTFQVPAPETSLRRDPSTCSTQIQANLITSSQIDLEADQTSVTDTVYDLDKESSRGFSVESKDSRYSSRGSAKSYVKAPEVTERETEKSFRPKRASIKSPSQDKVIVFDHTNPLNNVLLVPIDLAEAHRYSPKSNENFADNQSLHNTREGDTMDIRSKQIIGSVTLCHSLQPSGDTYDNLDTQSRLSNISKPVSVDESVTTHTCMVKDTEVNTVIAMKANKDLLEASSSLTLVDDALVQNAYDVDLGMDTAESSTTNNAKERPPVQIIYDEDHGVVLSDKADTDFLTSSDDMVLPIKVSTKGKKRIYSPANKGQQKYTALTSFDVTPKPNKKMQKLSNSPQHRANENESLEQLTAEKDDDIRSKSAMDIDSSDSKPSVKERKRPKSKKPGTSVTVQQLLTKYDIHADIDQEALNKQIIEALSRSDSSTAPTTVSLTDVLSKSPEIVSSCTSSNNQKEMQETCSVTTTVSRTLSSRSKSGKMEWQPEITETSSSVDKECDSTVNVVAKIDMLPFMGSHECEWEASGTDTWSFRLLHGRIRLCVRLAHRHDNATRTRVRADTPVHHVALDTAHAGESHECEWEASGTDTWSFRLLHGRIRLCVRLAHRHDNATRTRVRADTPVHHVALDTAHADKKNSVATLCVGYALEAMRFFLTRGCSLAGDVPALLRRCAGVARVALRWGRAMIEARLHLAYSLSDNGHLALKRRASPTAAMSGVARVALRWRRAMIEARLHLAYTLSDDGHLALKVANIPLRSVWEVTMRLELVTEEATVAPWPRACDVHVSRVVADVRVPDDEVQRALAHVPRDWGHAPRTVWKIFRYLKNKTRDDEVLGL